MAALLDFLRPKKQNPGIMKGSASPASVSEDVQNEIRSHGTPQVRVVFMGTPELAASLLSGLAEKKYNIVGVVTRPDSPIGRTQEITESAVKKKALEYGLPVEQPQTFDQKAIENIRSLKPDLIVVAAYGRLLPKELLEMPGFGCINVHTSLLPKWRGASPIQNALLAGETETGVTIMLMNEGMDTGDIIAQKKVSIDPDDTKESLMLRLEKTGKELLLETVPLWVRRKIVPISQDDSLATLCQLIEREDGRIIWTDEAENIYNRYRALSPWPGVFAFWKKDADLLRLKLHRISYQKHSPQMSHPIGQVFELGEKAGVQTGSGIVFLEEVQLEGKSRLPIAEFLLGNKDIIGSFLQ